MEQISDTSTAPVADDAKPSDSSVTVSSFTTPSSTDSSKGNKKARDGSHGLKFETKLLTLFCIRGLSAGNKFELGKENEDLAGKFDDVIFRYEVPDETPAGKHWRYHYLQAKHNENENGRRITANDLLDPNRKAPFTLKKYFLSYCKMRERGDDVRDCIVCTNWNINNEQFKRIQLEEVKEQHEILKFSSGEKTVRSYKLKIDDKLRSETIKLLEVSDIEAMRVTDVFISDTFKVQFKDKETKNSNENSKIQMLTLDLVTEKVVDSKTKKFRPDFINDENLSVVANKFRRKMCQVIDDFYSKLVFVVNMPNEKQFKQIIEKEDVSKYYPSDMCKIQTTRIFDEISDAFEKKPANFWLTSEEANKILLAGVTDVSLQYQKKLEEDMGFNDDAIKVMEKRLSHLMVTPGSNKIQWIATPSPQHTAVKVISAVQILMRELKQEGNYLTVSASRLQNEEEMEKWKNILKLQKGVYHFFVIVCDTETSIQNLENLISDDQADDKNNVICISRNGSLAGIKEEINYADLSKYFQEAILTKTVWFQGEKQNVENLIGCKPEEVIDFNSMKELLFEEKEIKIPSFKTSNFGQSLYIKRRLRFPFKNQFELSGECRINSDGHIEWLVEKKKRKEIWKKIMNDVTHQASSTGVIVDDLAHLKENGNEKSVVIISGLAGTGKSTLLCHYYEEIKKAKPDHWVIRINLVDYEAVLKLCQIAEFDVIDLFINKFHVVDDKSSFSHSILRKRLKTGDRIVVMFDGFDEINELCQKGAIQLIKAISKNKSIQLYVTTRPHMVEDLQFRLSQLTYYLENFTEKDQIDYLASYWLKELNLSGDNDGSLQQFAKSLVDRVSETLKDEEKSFVGIPLQCKILAECFQSNVKELITPNCVEDKEEHRHSEYVRDKISDLLDGQKFDLISLFNRLMETKRQVFREEKANASNTNQIIVDAINRLIQDIEDHLTKMAIRTIVTDQKMLDVLLPPQPYQSDQDIANGENTIALNGLKFGLLTFKNNDDSTVQFLHRTYAEYLFARYLYTGFLLDEKRNNKLLENSLNRKLILNKILAVKQYDGVQIFFDSMLKELVDNDEEWRNRIDSRNLPKRLKKFTKNLFMQFLRELPPLDKFGQLPPWNKFGVSYSRVTRSYFVNALQFSLENGNGTIFKFLCDCLDATFDNHQVQWAMKSSFMKSYCYFSFTFFRNKESKLFKRFIDYFDSNEASSIDSTIFSNFAWYRDLPPCGLEYSQWNGEEQMKTVHLLLKLMANQYEGFNHYFCANNIKEYIVPMLTFFIFNENYESHLNFFLELLSRSTAYSEDSKFANLLKKAFYSKEHFAGGRIEKVLIILRGLKRQNVLTKLYGIVLAIEPEAFQNIYQPPRVLMEKDAISEDLKKLLEPDSYRMTGLHRAAFHGDTEVVEKILEKIRKNLKPGNETKIMTRDEYGFTPFYVAAVRGQEKIYNNMLAYLKRNLTLDILKKQLNNTKGFIHNALSVAIKSENVQMVKLILNAFKRELGQNYLIDLLKTNSTKGSNISPSSFFVECQTKELFNAVAKIVVMRDDNVKDYTDLYDLISHDNSAINILKLIDDKNLQGFLLQNGVEDFTKRVLDKDWIVPNAFRFMFNYFIQHFTEDQLGQFVQTITLKNNKKKVRSSMTVTHVTDPAQAESMALYFSPEWTKDDLVFDDQCDGTTNIYAERLVPRPSYWSNLIRSALTAPYDDRRFVSQEDVRCILDCLKRVGDNSAKQLLLYEEDNGFIMIQSSQQIVQLMLAHLSQESQQEVKRQWKKNAPPMNTFLALTSVDNTVRFGLYYSDILQFYLNYGSDVHLNDFVNLVTMPHQIGEEQFTVWNCIFKNCDKETNEILKLVSEKMEILGRDAVQKLLLHEMDQIPLIIKSVSWGEDVDARLENLPKGIKEGIQQLIKQKAPEFIKNSLCDLKAFFKMFNNERHYNKLNSFTFFLNHHSDKTQLKQFVQNVTSTADDGENTRSIWAELLTNECQDHKTDDIAKMDKFMKCLSEKLDSNAVKELVLHKDDKRPVIFYPALRGEEKLLETMLKYLSAKDRKKVQRQVDEFLEETFKIEEYNQFKFNPFF